MEIRKKIIIVAAIIIALATVAIVCLNEVGMLTRGKTKLERTNGTTVVPTMLDELTADSTWCGTFQLVWNDMKNEVVKKDVVFTPQVTIAENLNKESFNESMLSEEYYYKTYGLKTLELKDEIEKGIKEKFNQTSDILDKFDWSDEGVNNPNNPKVKKYFFYTMLYREFEFENEFDKLPDGTFGEYTGIKYFGIDKNTKDKVGKQIDVLYYNSQDDFALLINTKSDDEVIFVKNPQGTTFNAIYEDMLLQASNYKGDKDFKSIDEFKAPMLEYNEEKEYKELQEKDFPTADPEYPIARIEKTLQTIKFELNEKGGKIKSEAAIDMNMTATAVIVDKKPTPRYFYVDDTFAIFLREKGKSMPYFAGRVEDITKYQ
ncbi:MAG: hypothetical protein IKK84_00975 [Clostridia bacterium]|nr:hypothetical protein [Clostridia bacterium]